MRLDLGRHTTPFRSMLAALAAGITLAAGCGTADETRAPAADTAGGGPVAASPAPAETLRGALPQPLDSFAGANGRAFRDFVRTFPQADWRGVERNRECTGAGCGPGASTRVELTALEGTHRMDLGALPANGMIVGRFVNRGNHTERMYGLARDNTVEAYYLVAEPVDPGTYDPANRQAVLRIVAMPRNPNAALVIEPRGERRLTDCRHTDDANPDSTHADFVDCDATARRMARQDTAAPADTGQGAMAVFLSARGWIACVHGCCEVGTRQ